MNSKSKIYRRNTQHSSTALASQEPTSAGKQKCFWREPLVGAVSLLDIGMSVLVIYDDVNDIRPEQISVTDSIRHIVILVILVVIPIN